MHRARDIRMRITSLEDLQILQLAQRLADEISAIIKRPGLEHDWELRRQLANCSARIPTQIAEGYGQRSGRHCAHYLSIARGSCNEMCVHLAVASGRDHITSQEKDQLRKHYERIGKGLTRWIQYLEQRRGDARRSVVDSVEESTTDPPSSEAGVTEKRLDHQFA